MDGLGKLTIITVFVRIKNLTTFILPIDLCRL